VADTYLCSGCREGVTRPYRVRRLIMTCDSCGEHGQFLHRAVVDRLTEIPPEDHPEGWEEMSLDERAEAAIKRGLISLH
jgi:hypothetical protein